MRSVVWDNLEEEPTEDVQQEPEASSRAQLRLEAVNLQ